jgi:hypothetical protein
MKPVPSIKTTYIPKKGEPERIRYWLPTLGSEYFSPSSYRIDMVQHQLAQFIQRIKEISFNAGVIEFIPVISEQLSENHDRTSYCGFIPYGYDSNGQRTSDRIQPIVIRGAELPEFTAKASKGWYGPEAKAATWGIHYNGTSLAPGQHKQLHEWFDAQLLAFGNTPGILDALKVRVLACAKASVVEYVREHNALCAKLLTFVREEM